MIYFLVIILSLIFAYKADNKRSYIKEEDNKTYEFKFKYLKFKNIKIIYNIEKIKYYGYCFLSFMPPFLVSSLRNYNIGTDTSGTYYEIHNKAINNITTRDFGYYLLNKLCVIISENYTITLILTSLLICGIAYNRIFNESKNVVLSTYLFFSTNVYFISMNMIRQSIAIMIFILAIPYIRKREFWKYLGMIILAFSFHTTGLLYLPLYFLYNIKINPKKIIMTIISVFIMGKFLNIIIYKIFKLVPYLDNYFSWYFTSKYNTGNFNTVSFLIAIIVMSVMIYVYDQACENSMYNLILWIQLIVCVFLALSGNLPLMQRTSWLFSFTLFIYLPSIIEFVKDEKIKKIIKFGIIVGYGLYMFITIFILKYNEVFPYNSIF